MLHKIVQVRNVYNFNFICLFGQTSHIYLAYPNYILNDCGGRDHILDIFVFT